MTDEPALRLDDYDFELPEELIAQVPAARRDDSRLLVLDRATGATTHRRFRDLTELLAPGDLLVVNRTRVIPARAFGTRSATGGRAEVLFLEPGRPGPWDVLLKTRGKPSPGEEVVVCDGRLRLELVERHERGRWIVSASEPPLPILEQFGTMPLPPYIRRAAGDDPRAAEDRDRYQTVYAQEPGAVAAPTAGLHFTPELLERLETAGVGSVSVTLHVGLGTFQPVEVEDLRDHVMHSEWYEVSEDAAARIRRARADGARVIAVGTTSVRSLESAWSEEREEVVARSGETRLFLHPPHRLRAVDAMITNFHLPKSTLLMLVSAFASRERILAAYREAVEERYRFFSFGDAMLIA